MLTEPELHILPNADAAAQRSAQLIAEQLRDAVETRGRATLALSGGRGPKPMFAALARESLPWDKVYVFQVDERIAPDGDPDRNAEVIRAGLGVVVERHAERFHWMPVTEPDRAAAAHRYERNLRAAAGRPPIIDVIHLGLGEDGHTASIFPGASLDEGHDVTVTDVRQRRRRMTLTTPVINRARSIVWLVTGREKAHALEQLLKHEPGLVASRIRRVAAVIVADAAAAPRGFEERSS